VNDAVHLSVVEFGKHLLVALDTFQVHFDVAAIVHIVDSFATGTAVGTDDTVDAVWKAIGSNLVSDLLYY
jgi:hypothetical protein